MNISRIIPMKEAAARMALKGIWALLAPHYSVNHRPTVIIKEPSDERKGVGKGESFVSPRIQLSRIDLLEFQGIPG